MTTIVTFTGLILNLIGTVIVSLSAGTVMICIHAALKAHQIALEKYLAGERDVLLFTGLDEPRKHEMDKSVRKLKTGLVFVIIGCLLQAAALFPQLMSALTCHKP